MWAIVCTQLLLVACQSTEPPLATTLRSATPINMAGTWELDYARSDNIDQQLAQIARQMRRDAERRARAAEPGQPVAAGERWRDVVDLAEMAKIITAPTLLEIWQSDEQVRVKRENSFALECQLDGATVGRLTNEFGEQRCGWDAQQLVFSIELDQTLTIRHRLTRSALADSLLLQTAVYSPTVAQPFIVNRIYQRYDPNAAGFRCRTTLSAGRVCTTESESP